MMHTFRSVLTFNWQETQQLLKLQCATTKTFFSEESCYSIEIGCEIRWIFIDFRFFFFFADLQLAAELGKTLLERNKELENLLRSHQRKCDDQKQEIEVSGFLGGRDRRCLTISNIFAVPNEAEHCSEGSQRFSYADLRITRCQYPRSRIRKVQFDGADVEGQEFIEDVSFSRSNILFFC